eukprot:8757042-Pyramimonas_sp.AAC.1
MGRGVLPGQNPQQRWKLPSGSDWQRARISDRACFALSERLVRGQAAPAAAASKSPYSLTPLGPSRNCL